MQYLKEDQLDPLLKPHRNKASLGQRLRYSFQNTHNIQQIYNGGRFIDTKTSPKRENNHKTTINLPKTPTLFYSLRRQPKRNIQTLTQSSQIERRNTMQISTGVSVNLDDDYGQVSQIEVLAVSQRPTAQNGDTRKISGASRMQSRIKFKTIEQSQEHKRTQSQLARSGDLTFEKTALCQNCLKYTQKTVSMANEIEELHDQISRMLADISRLAADLQQAKFLVIGSKITKENQSIKRSHVTENLELKVKLLQDSLTLRNQQFQEQEKQNQTLVQMLEKYDAKLELAQEQLEMKEKSASKTIPQIDDPKIIEDMMAYHQERLQNLKELKQKAKRLANIQSEDISKASFGHIPSNFRQSQKSINESNYSSEPMLANVKFN